MKKEILKNNKPVSFRGFLKSHKVGTQISLKALPLSLEKTPKGKIIFWKGAPPWFVPWGLVKKTLWTNKPNQAKTIIRKKKKKKMGGGVSPPPPPSWGIKQG